jgi:hypothetical protein
MLHGIKLKLSLGLTNEAPRHEGAKGSGCIDPRFLDLGIRWKLVDRVTLPPLYLWGKSPRYPLESRLGGPQSQSGRLGEEKLLSLPGLEFRPFGRYTN